MFELVLQFNVEVIVKFCSETFNTGELLSCFQTTVTLQIEPMLIEFIYVPTTFDGFL